MKVIVASLNPVKINAAKQAFIQVFGDLSIEVGGIHVPSGVSDQPMSDGETRQGAVNRAISAQKAHPEADYWVGMEGGIEDQQGSMLAFGWMVVAGRQGIGKGRTATFILPPEVAALVREGIELGEADDRVFGSNNSKQKSGAVGLLTGDIMNRTELYCPAVVLALIPFINQNLYFGGKETERPEKH